MRKTSLNSVTKLAKKDKRVIFIGSDLGAGTMDEFQKNYPDRFFMEGIAEQNMIGMAAGLAMDGYIPYLNTIASFITRRCLEQITIDLCLHNLPVRLLGNGGGLVYAPLGPTHLAPDDIALMRTLPNMTIVAPSDAMEMAAIMKETLELPGPVYIRLGKGGDPVVFPKGGKVKIGKALELREGRHAIFISTGIMSHRALVAAEMLAKKGLDCAVIHFHTIKPLDHKAILAAASEFPIIITLEEHSSVGGLGSAVSEVLVDNGPFPRLKILRLSLPDSFQKNYGSQDALLEAAGLHPKNIAKTLLNTMFGA
ncbi:MAG: transketolase [Magnetococcales bacterium]|nr:transketolase [Magnetococcales bacterium]